MFNFGAKKKKEISQREEAYENALKKLKAELAAKSAEHEQSQAQIQALRDDINNKTIRIKEVEAETEEIEKLISQQDEKFNTQKAKIAEDSAQAVRERDQLKIECASLYKDRDGLRTTMEKREEEAEENARVLQEKLDEAKQRIAVLSAPQPPSAREIEAIAKVDMLDEQAKTLKLELEAARAQVEKEQENTVEQLETARREVHQQLIESRDATKQVEESLEGWQSAYHAMVEDRDAIHTQLEGKEQEHQQLREEHSDLLQAHAAMSVNHNHEIDSLKSAISAAEAVSRELEASLGDERGRCSMLEGEVVQMREQYATQTAETESRDGIILALQSENDLLRTQCLLHDVGAFDGTASSLESLTALSVSDSREGRQMAEASKPTPTQSWIQQVSSVMQHVEWAFAGGSNRGKASTLAAIAGPQQERTTQAPTSTGHVMTPKQLSHLESLIMQLAHRGMECELNYKKSLEAVKRSREQLSVLEGGAAGARSEANGLRSALNHGDADTRAITNEMEFLVQYAMDQQPLV